jgi:uncharacterized protein YjbJ (UPF0337 family)
MANPLEKLKGLFKGKEKMVGDIKDKVDEQVDANRDKIPDPVENVVDKVSDAVDGVIGKDKA